MEIKEQLQEIKTKLRLSMNGVVSQSMREKGLAYKLNFGVELPRIKEIADGYEKNHDLAQALWKEDVRELKILAGFLQPIDSFYPDIADIWVENIHNPEIAEITCMSLFQYLPYAADKAFQWMADEREYFQLCGFLLIARLLAKGSDLNDRAEAEFLDQALAAVQSSELILPRNAAILALKKFGTQSETNAKKLIKQINSFRRSGNADLRAAYEEIRFEIEYLL